MPEGLEITYYDSKAEVRAAWKSLVLNGGCTLHVDADGALHALRLNSYGGDE